MIFFCYEVIMMNQLAQKLSSFFVLHDLISSDEQHIYTYCFEIILSSIFAWGSVICIAILANLIFPTILYMGGFFIFRSLAGGYHAKTHLNCYFLSLTTYLLFLFVAKLSPVSGYWIVSIIFIVIATPTLFFLAPVDHKNNPFTDDKKWQLKIKIRILLFIYLFIMLFLLYLDYVSIVFYFSCGFLQAAISVAVAFNLNRKEEKTCIDFSSN